MNSYKEIENKIIFRFNKEKLLNLLDICVEKISEKGIYTDSEGGSKSLIPIKTVYHFILSSKGKSYKKPNDELSEIKIDNIIYICIEIKFDKENKIWIIKYVNPNDWKEKLTFKISFKIKKWEEELLRMQEVIENKYLSNFKMIKNNTNKIRDSKKPLLIYNSENNIVDDPDINIYSMIHGDKYDFAFFGSLAGNFTSINDKREFWKFLNTLINFKSWQDNDSIKNFIGNIRLRWINEIYVFFDCIKSQNLIDFKKDHIKVYKFESPDFIIIKNQKEVIGVEITQLIDKWYYVINEEESFFNDEGWKHFGYNTYEEISESDILTIIKQKHFDKYKKYVENINSYFKCDIKIWYFIPLGGPARLVEAENDSMKKIIDCAIKSEIHLQDVYLYISAIEGKELKTNYWYSLENIKAMLEYW